VLWRTYGDCENYGILSGHKGAILDLHWSRDSRVLFSASADKMLASWDLETGTRIRRHTGHEEVINCMDVSKRGEEMLVSGSDDGYLGVSDVAFRYGPSNADLLQALGFSPERGYRLHRD
jgi:Prp8 binding protein